MRKPKKTLRDELYEVFTVNINWEGFTGTEDDIFNGVDAVLAVFSVRRKRKKPDSAKSSTIAR